MKIAPQSTPDLIRLGELIADRPLAMLTSMGDDGALVSCPMEALEMDAEGALWFFTDLRLELVERLRVINLSFADDVRGTYVSISGRGEIAKDPVRIERLWSRFDRAAFPEGPGSRHLALLRWWRTRPSTGTRRTAARSACSPSPSRQWPAPRWAASTTRS
jgi:general stress protein 26